VLDEQLGCRRRIDTVPGMRIESVDERDSTWDRHDATYRVYLFSGGDRGGSWATDTYNVEDADVDEVIDWAKSRMGSGDQFSIALREVEGDERGLIWLVGSDLNDGSDLVRPPNR